MAIIKQAINCCGDCKSWKWQKICINKDSPYCDRWVTRGYHCELWQPWKTMQDIETEDKKRYRRMYE